MEIEAAREETRGARESDEQRLFEILKLGKVAEGARRERDEVAKGVQVAEKEIGAGADYLVVPRAASRPRADDYSHDLPMLLDELILLPKISLTSTPDSATLRPRSSKESSYSSSYSYWDDRAAIFA